MHPPEIPQALERYGGWLIPQGGHYLRLCGNLGRRSQKNGFGDLSPQI